MNGLEGLLEGKQIPPARRALHCEALDLIQKILKGRYTVTDGEERIWMDTGRYVKINFASSGQQECVWILNLLYYYFVMQNPVYFIIEEPESNLFPESQKAIVELTALVAGAGNAVLLTTHSPYVLGAVNNLLYAGTVGQIAAEKSAEIVAPEKWIDACCRCAMVFTGLLENFHLLGIPTGIRNLERRNLPGEPCKSFVFSLHSPLGMTIKT